MNALKAWIQRYQLSSMVLLLILLAVVLPLTLDIFRLNLVGKYLTYAFVAIGLVMVWGYGGVLSLGQGVFFGLGGYAMAMFLKLEASDPVSTSIQSTPGIPDFMDWNQITALPAFWMPFKSLPFALAAVVAVPMLLAFIISFAMFKRRVGGVYFAIITQAVALILTVLIIGQQGYTGGVNGMTDLKTVLGWDTRTDSAKYILYYVCVGLLIGSMVLCRWVQTSKLGTLLLAMRDKEDRVRFSGYDVADFKVFTFCLAAALSGIGGALFSLQVGFMSPSFVGIVPSIEMVIYAAVGGNLSGGQQQQLAIARALVTNPKVLLLDEPTEGIQPSIIKDIAKALNEIRKMRGITIIVSEQVLSFAMEVADRLFVIEGGRLVHETMRADTDQQRIKAYLSV